MYEMHVITEARPRRKSSVKMRCNMISTINSLFMLKKRNTEESMLQTVLSSLLTDDAGPSAHNCAGHAAEDRI